MERTLLIVKPDAVAAGHTGRILSQVLDSGLRVVAMEMRRLAIPEARAFYAVHKGKDFYHPLVAFMTEGPVVLCTVEGPDAVARLRSLVGATDPAKAAEGTIRARFGSTVQRNAVHASDTVENAAWEVGFFFPSCRFLAEAP